MNPRKAQQSQAYWEDCLCDLGLGMDSGAGFEILLPLELVEAQEGPNYPDLMDIIEYKRDHLELV